MLTQKTCNRPLPSVARAILKKLPTVCSCVTCARPSSNPGRTGKPASRRRRRSSAPPSYILHFCAEERRGGSRAFHVSRLQLHDPVANALDQVHVVGSPCRFDCHCAIQTDYRGTAHSFNAGRRSGLGIPAVATADIERRKTPRIDPKPRPPHDPPSSRLPGHGPCTVTVGQIDIPPSFGCTIRSLQRYDTRD